MKRVLLFGSFDIIHAGHRYVFEQARAYGDEVWAVLARDKRILELKGRLPHFSEEERQSQLSAEKNIDHVILGSAEDVYECLEIVMPSVILLGYDQHAYTLHLGHILLQKNMTDVKVVRLDAYYPEQYKSSIMRASIVED